MGADRAGRSPDQTSPPEPLVMSRDPYLKYLESPNRPRFARFVVAYMNPVARFVRRVVRCPETSDDVTQEVFVRLSETRPSPEDVPNPRAYVLRAALNTARKHLRRESTRARHERRAGRLKDKEQPAAEDDAISRETIERLHECMDSLPDSFRVAIHLRAVEGLSYKEIAEITGASVGTVSMRIRRARRKLEQSMGHAVCVRAFVELREARRAGVYPGEAGEISPELVKSLSKTSRAKTGVPKGVLLGLVGAAASLVFLGTPLFRSAETASRVEAERSSAAVGLRHDSSVTVVASPLKSPETLERTKVKAMASPVVAAQGVAEPDETVFGQVESTAENTDGGETMKRSANVLFPAVLALGVLPAMPAAETGDVDGDGRLTIADIVHLEGRLAPAEGSIAAFGEFPCNNSRQFFAGTPDWPGWIESRVVASIYLESLRRGVDGSLAHWDNVWPEDIASEPLPEDARCGIELLPGTAPGGSNDRARLQFKLTVQAPVRSFSVVLEAPPGLLEAPLGGFGEDGPPHFDNRVWRDTWRVMGHSSWRHDFGDVPVEVTAQTFLITGGRYVVAYDLRDSEVLEDLQPGEYLVAVEARVALHTAAGTYPIRVHPASEVLFRDGTVARSIVTAESELTIENDVTQGLDDGVPPLELDRENNEVLGRIEFRLVDADGNAAEPGQPLLEVLNDEEVRMRLQLRTEVPLNQLRYALHWRTAGGLDIECVERRPEVLFASPDGTPYAHWTDKEGKAGQSNECGSRLGNGRVQGTFTLAGARNSPTAHNRADRPLEYFRPLDTWLDIVEFRLHVPDEAPGGLEIPFRFDAGPVTHEQKEKAAFVPYGEAYPCANDSWPPEDPVHWKYNVIYHDTFIRVIGDDPEPPGPPDLGIRVELGAASGAPGDLVELPIHAAADVELGRLRIALELDPAVLSVEGVELDVVDDRTRAIVKRRIGRSSTLLYSVCTDEDGDGVKEFCTQGHPTVAHFWTTDESLILLDLLPSSSGVGGQLVEIGRFLLRIADDAAPGETVIAPGEVPRVENNFELLIETGGNVEDQGLYSPASEVVPGKIIIVSNSRDFVRGDANIDGKVNVSDAALMLGVLFTASAEALCEDAADADDNGALNITDPILLLGVLFGGDGELPLPSTCAADPTADGLGCEEGCDAG